MATRIMIIDDHKLIRDGLKAIIERDKHLQVIAEAGDGLSAVQTAAKVAPDIVIIDIGMPQMNGIEATKRIIALKCKPRVIALSMHADRRYVAQMLKAGASGYILKDSAFDELDQAITAVEKGLTFLSPGIAGTVVSELRRTDRDDEGSAFLLLSEREREVLQQISEGSSTTCIAAALGISIKTVETHRRQIMDKLDIHSIAGLTKFAIREGLTELEK